VHASGITRNIAKLLMLILKQMCHGVHSMFYVEPSQCYFTLVIMLQITGYITLLLSLYNLIVFKFVLTLNEEI
jgi:hypothetical protein